jgi:hypothetical protein
MRRVFRPVPGLGVSTNNHSLKAVPQGYFLSPFGLDVSEEPRVGWRVQFSDYTERSNRSDGA